MLLKVCSPSISRNGSSVNASSVNYEWTGLWMWAAQCYTWWYWHQTGCIKLSFWRLTNDLTRLSSQFRTRTICYHNNVETGGRRGQGVAIFIHNSLARLVQLWRVSVFLSSCLGLYQRVSFWDSGECFWGLCTLILLFFPFWGWDLSNVLAHATRCFWSTKR